MANGPRAAAEMLALAVQVKSCAWTAPLCWPWQPRQTRASCCRVILDSCRLYLARLMRVLSHCPRFHTPALSSWQHPSPPSMMVSLASSLSPSPSWYHILPWPATPEAKSITMGVNIAALLVAPSMSFHDAEQASAQVTFQILLLFKCRCSLLPERAGLA